MFDAASYMDLRRLPELFCGFRRVPGKGPTFYPVACSPQAWASATPFAFLQACLGLSFDPAGERVRFRQPRLPDFLDQVVIRKLRGRRQPVRHHAAPLWQRRLGQRPRSPRRRPRRDHAVGGEAAASAGTAAAPAGASGRVAGLIALACWRSQPARRRERSRLRGCWATSLPASEPSALKARAPEPGAGRWRASGPGAARAICTGRENVPGRRMVLVPGAARRARTIRAWSPSRNTFARARFAVLVPEIAGSAHPAAEPRGRATGRRRRSAISRRCIAPTQAPAVGVAAISYAAGPALLAALAPANGGPRRVRDRDRRLL